MSRTGTIDVDGPLVLVVMGVSGSGKTTVATDLAVHLGWEFEEGDSLHPQANVDKMAAGHPLNDEDRWPWLATIADWIDGVLDAGGSGVVTCSALKRSYRDILGRRGSCVGFVLLDGTKAQIEGRLEQRLGHYMPSSLLDSQFADLEQPGDDEPVIAVSVAGTPAEIVDEILVGLGLPPA